MRELILRLTELPQFQELKTELAINSRLRWLVFSVLVVFLVYFVLVMDDLRIEVVDEYRTIAMREARLESLQEGAEADFAEYYAAQEAANQNLRARFWLAGSQGLAGAELQSWLRLLAIGNNMTKLRLDLSDIRPVPGMSEPVWRLEAELGGEITPHDARALLAAIARSENVVVVERLSYSPPRNDALNLRLVANFLIGDAPGEGGP
jgi:hypothetical protein